MIDQKIKRAFSKTFDMRHFIPGYQGIKKEVDPTSKSVHFWIEHLWVAEISFYYYAPIIVGGIRYASDRTKFPRLHRAALLVNAKGSPYIYEPDMPEEKGGFLGENPYRFVELGEEIDPVSRALQQTTLFPVAEGESGSAANFLVHGMSEGSTAQLFWYGIPQDEQTIRVRDAILKMVDDIVRAYDDPEITSFFAKGRGPW
jgi:hypothetical protein